MQQFVTLVGHVTWPITVLIIVFLVRNQIQSLLQSVSKRVNSDSTDLKVSLSGFEISKNIDSRMESLEEDIEFFKVKIAPNSDDKIATKGASDELHELANKYLYLGIENHSERVRAKNALARQMTKLSLLANIAKPVLASSDNEEILLACLGRLHLDPKPSDADLLVRVAGKIRRLHVRYRAVLVFERFHTRGLLNSSHRKESVRLCGTYRESADFFLAKVIDRYLLQLTTGES